ncbi:taspase, threonine aspartase, 1 [Nematocida displodere]|uniref:Taspase, threonine aspartase, 1 n=1 Tax=Nematocida displodere TaxID=1805483 RepID=A0A177ED29_9MICR|nr:taspase, threonine aspartase, 1 [Nematocida displodere]
MGISWSLDPAMKILAVHLGAGECSALEGARLKRALKKYLRPRTQAQGRGVMEAVEVMKEIESGGLANCGVGSNCTANGAVENEACIMTGPKAFACVCLVPLPLSPTVLASNWLAETAAPGYVKPLTVAYTANPLTNPPPSHILTQPLLRDPNTPKTPKTPNTPKTPAHSDTAGVIYVSDCSGLSGLSGPGTKAGGTDSVCVSSSGGPRNKPPGRVGPCSVYGANTFRAGRVSTCVSGTGEALIRTMICRKVSALIESEDFERIRGELSLYMEEEPEFPHLGGISIFRKSDQTTLLIHFQTAPSFVFGYSVQFQGPDLTRTPEHLQKLVYHSQPSKQVTVQILSIGDTTKS